MISETAPPSPLAYGTYVLDPWHSSVHFQIRYLGISSVRGMFTRFDAELVIGDSLEDVHVTASVDLSSISTNDPVRDTYLRATELFHADTPEPMTLHSTAVRHVSESAYELNADLTINGITKPITLDLEFNGCLQRQADRSLHAGFSASGGLLRSEYAIELALPPGIDKFAVDDVVLIDIDAHFIAR